MVAYLGVLVGAVVAFSAQWVAYYFAKRREYWIRRLNSFQDFYQHSMNLLDLLEADLVVPQNLWDESLRGARKAAYDADIYAPDRTDLTKRMKAISQSLVGLSTHRSTETVAKLRSDVIRLKAESSVRGVGRLWRRADVNPPGPPVA